VNFFLLFYDGYQFAPRYRDLHRKMAGSEICQFYLFDALGKNLVATVLRLLLHMAELVPVQSLQNEEARTRAPLAAISSFVPIAVSFGIIRKPIPPNFKEER
jgi:hypothetical protein